MFLATAMGAARASARAGARRSGPGRRVVAWAGKGALARAHGAGKDARTYPWRTTLTPEILGAPAPTK